MAVERRSIWGLLAAAALLWPARLGGPLDGVPLDQPLEAVLIGLVVPALWWFHPRFLTTTFARGCVLALFAWKALTAVVLVQDGLCIRFMPAAPLVKDAAGVVPHSWDLRADWRAPVPSCSAIMTRQYSRLSEFPAWFFNLPPPNDSWPGPRDRPPGAATGMTASGFLRAPAAGRLSISTGADMSAAVHLDDEASLGYARSTGLRLTPGVHRILIDAALTGDQWQFVALWNGTDVWSRSMATVERPSRIDLAVRPWGKWITVVLVIALTLAWLVSAVARIRDAGVLLWTVGAASVIGLLAALGHDVLARGSLVALLGATLVNVPTRLKNNLGAFALVGVPWLTLVAVVSAPTVGRFRLYEVGNDYWAFQRFAYRIVMQGYWLEGGSPTFWFQPFYRWIVGLLHLAFGDSSLGEWYWDGACILAMALFAFHVTKVFAGFRWGIGAAVTTLTVFALGTTWRYLGIGLSDISSAGLLSLAAIVALRSRHGNWRAAMVASILALLAFYTRLNNLPMALAVAAFALPVVVPTWLVLRLSVWRFRAAWLTAAAVCATLCAGILLFALRTWRYTGVFSFFYGTSAYRQAVWQPGMSLHAYLTALASSVMMVLTMNDPPQFDARALPIFIGAIASVLAVVGVPRLRNLPLAPVLFCLAGILPSLFARGEAYSGRFSIHLIGVSSSLAVCSAALLWQATRARSRRSEAGNRERPALN
jgi:hypothetical protein